MKVAAIVRRTRVQFYLLAQVFLFFSGLALMASNIGVLFALGTGIAAAGVAGLALLVYVYLTENTASHLALLTTFGLTHAFAARSVAIKAEYDDRLASARSHIDIIGFGLRSLRQDYLAQFEGWGQRAVVRILIIDPEFPSPGTAFADQRDREEDESVGTIRRDVERFIQDTVPHRNARFHVKVYRCIPAINYFRIDDEIFWGPYLIGAQSRNMPTFVVQRGGNLFDRLAQHFEDIWTSTEFSADLSAINAQSATDS